MRVGSVAKPGRRRCRRRRRRRRPRPPASRLIFMDIFIFAWTIYLGSTVIFNAFYEYCGLFCMSVMRVGGGDSCNWCYYDRK